MSTCYFYYYKWRIIGEGIAHTTCVSHCPPREFLQSLNAENLLEYRQFEDAQEMIVFEDQVGLG